jgi:hypothetical protein
MATYRLISSDSHIIEPADLWQERIDRPFRDRAPHLVHEAEADQWYADGVKFGAIGINPQAGVRFETPEHLTLQGRMATVPRGGFDPICIKLSCLPHKHGFMPREPPPHSARIPPSIGDSFGVFFFAYTATGVELARGR